jgi:hypothetical protein
MNEITLMYHTLWLVSARDRRYRSKHPWRWRSRNSSRCSCSGSMPLPLSGLLLPKAWICWEGTWLTTWTRPFYGGFLQAHSFSRAGFASLSGWLIGQRAASSRTALTRGASSIIVILSLAWFLSALGKYFPSIDLKSSSDRIPRFLFIALNSLETFPGTLYTVHALPKLAWCSSGPNLPFKIKILLHIRILHFPDVLNSQLQMVIPDIL